MHLLGINPNYAGKLLDVLPLKRRQFVYTCYE